MTIGSRGTALEQSLESRLAKLRTCPHCESPNLIRTEGDLFCAYCDWNSLAETTSTRGLRLLFNNSGDSR
jgi:hypothetical protein